MKKTLLGIENIDYMSRKSGNPVKGVSLHVMGESSRVKGHGVETIFVSSKAGYYEDVLQLPLGCEMHSPANTFSTRSSLNSLPPF